LLQGAKFNEFLNINIWLNEVPHGRIQSVLIKPLGIGSHQTLIDFKGTEKISPVDTHHNIKEYE
jgi:hypothetical protein